MKLFPARLTFWRAATLFAAHFLSPSLFPADEGKAEATGEAGKKFVLFMGADLAVQRDKRYFRVEDVSGSELVIRNGKREFMVPTRNRQTGIKVNHSLKLSPGSVQLDDLESGPSYTPANDPVHKFNAESGAAGGAAAVRDLAFGRMMYLEQSLAYSLNAASSGIGAQAGVEAARAAYEEALSQYREAERQAESANNMQLSQQFNTPAAAERMKLDQDLANYDAMEVSFKVSSPVPLEDPYMVILFKFQERDAKPGDVGLLIHAKSLEPIGPKPKYIRVREGGMPRGFKYLDCEVHLYNRGDEVATNKSAKRVELTRDEAQQYLVIEHIGAHKGASVPAILVPGTLSATRRQQLSTDQLNRVFFVRVAKDGNLIGAFVDEGCNLKLEDAGTLTALREVFFKPALEQGKPVEGTARVRLGDS